MVRRKINRLAVVLALSPGIWTAGSCAPVSNVTSGLPTQNPPMSMVPGQYAPKGITPSWPTAKWLPSRNTSKSYVMIDRLAEQHRLTIASIEAFRGPQKPSVVDSGTNDVYLYGLYRGYTEHLAVEDTINTILGTSVSSQSNATRSYARALFLCFAMREPFGYGQYYWMNDLGNRLLAEDPSDYDVMFGVVRISRPETSAEIKKHMLLLVDKMTSMRPRDKRSYNAAYDVYMPCFLAHVAGNISDVNGAIAAMQERVKLETDPATVSEYTDILSRLKISRARIANAKDSGSPPGSNSVVQQPSVRELPPTPQPPVPGTASASK